MNEYDKIKRRLARQQEIADARAIKEKTLSRMQLEFDSDSSQFASKLQKDLQYRIKRK